jgi:hypothetical protein
VTRITGQVGVGPGWPPSRTKRDVFLSARYPSRATIGEAVVEPVWADVRVTGQGKFSIDDVEPGFIQLRIQHGNYLAVRTLAVPDSETADYATLVEVDPATLDNLPPLTDAVDEAFSTVLDDPASATAAALSATIARTQPSSIIAALTARSPSLNIAIAGDSTGDGTDEWVSGLASRIATAYPHLRVVTKLWDPTPEAYQADVVVQAGTGPTKANRVSRRDSFKRVAADLIGTPTEVGATNWSNGGGAAGNWSANGSHALAGTHATRGPLLLTTGARGASRTRFVYEFVATGTHQVDLYDRFSAGRIFVTLNLNGDGTVLVNLSKRVGGTPSTIQTLGNIPMPGDKTFTVEVNVTPNGDGSAAVAATVNGAALSGNLSIADWTEVSGSTQAGIFVVNGTPTGDKWHLFEAATTDEVFAQQTLTIYNGSRSGSTLDYQLENFAAMYPAGVDFDQLWVSSSHNETTMTPDTYLAKITSFVDTFRAAYPAAAVVLSSQNPEFGPISAARIGAHRLRCAALRDYAAAHRYGYVPVIEEWEEEPDGGYLLMNGDGIHPATPGSSLWADVAFEFLTA